MTDPRYAIAEGIAIDDERDLIILRLEDSASAGQVLARGNKACQAFLPRLASCQI